MKKTFLNNFFICFLIFLLLSLDFIKVFAQTSQSIYIAPNKTNFVLGDKVCIGISDLPGAESGTSTKIKLYTDGPNSECKDGCEQDLLFIRSPFGNNALCMTPTDKDEVGSWNAYIEYNGIKSNTISYKIADKEELANQISNNEITQKFQSYLKANGFDNNITVYPGNTINYTFWSNVTGSDDFTIESWYTSDTPDNCPGGITRPGEVKPWILSGRFASTGGTSSVQDCQAGKTYKITVVLRDRQGNIVGGDTLNVSVRSPSERTINPSFCDAIQSGNTYTLDQITKLMRPAYEEQYYSCTLQRNSGDVKYYVPDGNPSSVPPGNAYYADWNYTEISPDGKLITKKIPKGIILCSYDNPLTATLSNAPLSLDFCDLGGGFKSRTDYCLKNDMGADDFAQKNIQALKQEIQSSCGKSINIVLDSSQNIGLNIGSNLNNQPISNLPITSQGLFANGQKNISVYVGDVINYTWRGPDGVGYTYSSNYIADAPDNCPGGVQSQGEIKPWVAKTKQGLTSDRIQQCQAGRTYTISYLTFNSSGNVVYRDSIIVKVLTGQRTTSNQNRVGQYNPLDVSFYTGPTTFSMQTSPSLSSKSQLQSNLSINTNVLNSLSDTIAKINSILEGAKNLSQEDQDIISKTIQTVLGTLQNLITSLTLKNSQNQSQIPETSLVQKVSTSTPGAKISVAITTSTTTFRYIKDDISKSGWVAIREMKFYDANNNEIKPVNANASCDWCGYGTPPSYSVGPKGVFDGNWGTVWNAGETAENCSWYVSHLRDDGIYGVGCSASKIRKAWINVDLGAPVSLSKIKIHVMGDSNNRLDSLSGSIDGENYIDLCKIQASKDMPLVDLGPTGDWIECNLEK